MMRVFNETQKFDQWWWVKLIHVVAIATLFYFFYSWHIAHEAVDKVGPNDTIGQLIVVASILPIFILFKVLKLKTEIDEIGVHYQFLPFQFSKNTVRWGDMDKCYVRTYRPIREYGGWGYRASFGSKGKAYNVRGNKGIQLILKNGDKILIGTQKPEDAQSVINRKFKKDEGI